MGDNRGAAASARRPSRSRTSTWASRAGVVRPRASTRRWTSVYFTVARGRPLRAPAGRGLGDEVGPMKPSAAVHARAARPGRPVRRRRGGHGRAVGLDAGLRPDRGVREQGPRHRRHHRRRPAWTILLYRDTATPCRPCSTSTPRRKGVAYIFVIDCAAARSSATRSPRRCRTRCAACRATRCARRCARYRSRGAATASTCAAPIAGGADRLRPRRHGAERHPRRSGRPMLERGGPDGRHLPGAAWRRRTCWCCASPGRCAS